MNKNQFYLASIASSVIGLLLVLLGVSTPTATFIDITLTCSIPFISAVACYLVGESK